MKNFQKNFRFSSAKIFFSHRPQNHKFRISPYFSCFSTFPPVSPKLLFPPYFHKFSPCFRKMNLLFTYFMCISFPPTLTMMHLCITQWTYWTPLRRAPAYSRALNASNIAMVLSGPEEVWPNLYRSTNYHGMLNSPIFLASSLSCDTVHRGSPGQYHLNHSTSLEVSSTEKLLP